MDRHSMIDQLDSAVDGILAGEASSTLRADHEIAELVAVAAELRHLAHPDFRTRLKQDLIARAAGQAASSSVANDADSRMLRATPQSEILPTLFRNGYGTFPVHRANFAVSFVLHAAAMAFIIWSGMWVVENRQQLREDVVAVMTDPSPYLLSPAPDEAGGGGGGGDRDMLEASRGALPQAARDQITPPSAVVRAENPRLVVPPTVVLPPNVNLPQLGQLGDPLSNVVGPASNGTGAEGGIGSGSGGGVGSGIGVGVGPGTGGGIGGGVYRVGGGVSAPRAIYDPNPEYSDEARRAKYQGTVTLWVIISPDGKARDIRVARSLGMGLDEKAMEAVRTWRFHPATKDGHPVAVQVNIEVNFRLY